MDAVTSFQYLVDNLPSWKEQITNLTSHTSQKHEEFKADYVRLLTKAKPKHSRSPSVASIHTIDDTESKDVEMNQDSSLQPPNLADINPLEAGNRYIYAQATKKRKPGTSFRSGASGPMKFRSKQMVVIYYDSHVQDKLDSLVKALGASRNNLRKGKMAYTISKGLQLPTLGRKYDTPASMSTLDGIRSTSLYRDPTKPLTIKGEISYSAQETPTGEAAFKQADKDLEICQNLCETAAHQFLRDGDCRLELDAVLRNLEKVSQLSNSTLETLKSEEQISAENASSAGSLHTESDATLVEKSSREPLNFYNKLGPQIDSYVDQKRPSPLTVNSAPPAMTEIEVDDDSDSESIEIDITNFRSTRTAVRS